MAENPESPERLERQPTVNGADMHGDDVPEDVRRRLAAARVVVAAAVSPKVEFTVDAIAKATTLLPATVQEILSSEEWKEVVRDNLMLRVNGLLGRYLVRAEQILRNDKAGARTHNETGRVLTQLHKTLTDSAPGQNRSNSLQDALSALDNLEKANKLKRAQVKVTDASN